MTFSWPTTFGAPFCIRVKSSQTISFTGVDSFHPLIQDCGPTLPIAGTKSAPFSQMLAAPGIYGMHCPNHGTSSGTGMALAVEVVP